MTPLTTVPKHVENHIAEVEMWPDDVFSGKVISVSDARRVVLAALNTDRERVENVVEAASELLTDARGNGLRPGEDDRYDRLQAALAALKGEIKL